MRSKRSSEGRDCFLYFVNGAKVRAPADLLSGYYHAVHELSLEYVAGVTADELCRVVDKNWDPPVTASARIVSIIDDCAQHLGQAAYLRGIQ